MPEILLLIIVSIAFMPPLIAAMFARRLHRSFWLWFFIGCVLPFIAVFIIAFLPEIEQAKNQTEQ